MLTVWCVALSRRRRKTDEKYCFNKIIRAWLHIFAKWNHDSYKFMTKAAVSQSIFLSSHSQDCYAQSSTTCRRCSDSYRRAPIWWESMLWQWLVLPDSTHICFLTIPSVMDKPAGNKDRMAIHRGIWAASARKNGWQHRAVWIIKKRVEKWRGRDKIGTGKEMPLPCLCRVKWYELLFWFLFPLTHIPANKRLKPFKYCTVCTAPYAFLSSFMF